MFFEGAFEAAGLGFDYADFSVRIAERDLPDLVTTLRAIPPARVAVRSVNASDWLLPVSVTSIVPAAVPSLTQTSLLTPFDATK